MYCSLILLYLSLIGVSIKTLSWICWAWLRNVPMLDNPLVHLVVHCLQNKSAYIHVTYPQLTCNSWYN